MNNQAFINLVEDKTQAILSAKDGTPGRQSIATTRGQQVEVAAAELLAKHPNVARVETQVFESDLDEFSNIDIVVTTRDGRTVFVPCARDIWVGTSQQDRLQVVWEKFKAGVFDRYDVCYLCLDDVNNILNKTFTRRARRGVTIQRVCSTLFDHQNLMNFDHLWIYLMDS